MERTCLAIILAAGESTRMKSSVSKVLHPVAGQSLQGLLVSSLLPSWADERRSHRQGVSLPDFITHHGSPVGVS